MEKVHRRLIVLFVGLAAIAALLVPKLVSFGEAKEAEAPSAAPQTLRVDVEELKPERLVERLSTTGTVRANEHVELVSEVAGKVREIEFHEGGRVQAGQLLVKIDDTELQAERDRAIHRVELAQRREARQRELLDQGVISQEDYDSVLSQLEILQAEQRLIEAQLVKTEIRAPFGGIIGLRQVSVGSYLSPQTQIATLQDTDRMKIDFSVPEKYAPRMRIGGEVTFRVKGSERTFHGTIYAIEPRVDLETRSLQLRARSPNPDGSLVPGAFADVELVVRDVPDALTVPSMAVIPELGGKKVFVVEEGKAQPRAVETGIRTEERLQVVAGLEAGEKVIVSAIQQLRPGLEVEAE